jgi:invasion protein IalB
LAAGLALALGATLAPARSQSGGSWVKLCDSAGAGACRTLTEQIHPETGQIMVAVTFRQAKADGAEKNVLRVTVPPGVVIDNGAAVTVLPPDLWRKLQQGRKLDAADETRMKPRTFKLSFKRCGETECMAEAEAPPLLVDLMKNNAGLLVLTVRPPGRPVAQPVPLNGFAQALAGRPTDSERFKEAREQLMKQISARRATGLGAVSAPAGPPAGSAIAPGTGQAIASSGPAPWVKVCDTGKLKGKTKDGSDIEKTVEMCMTVAEPLNPKTGQSIITATHTHMRLDGKEKEVFSLVIPGTLKLPTDTTVAILPAELWQKAKGKEALDSSDESRLEASTVKVPVKFCLPAGCHAEIEATPQFVDMLKSGAGLRVRTINGSGRRDTKLVSLDGFEQALSAPPTEMTVYKAAREQRVKDILAREKAKKKREERARKKKAKEDS